MKGNAGSFTSSFTNSDGIPFVIDEQKAVFTVCSRADMKTGGHAYCYVERIQSGLAEMIRFELVTPGHGRVQLSQSRIQNKRISGQGLEDADYELRHLATTKHHSYPISAHQATRIVGAFMKFDQKNARGRYVYSKPGGLLGRAMGALTGQRGVNCADLVMKMMSDAGIAYVQDKLFNTPRYASGSSNR
jgi:hypothetical protein